MLKYKTLNKINSVSQRPQSMEKKNICNVGAYTIRQCVVNWSGILIKHLSFLLQKTADYANIRQQKTYGIASINSKIKYCLFLK